VIGHGPIPCQPVEPQRGIDTLKRDVLISACQRYDGIAGDCADQRYEREQRDIFGKLGDRPGVPPTAGRQAQAQAEGNETRRIIGKIARAFGLDVQACPMH